MLKKRLKKQRRHRRVRAKIKGTAEVPRLCVFRSANHIYAQLINDEKGKTLIAANDLEIKKPTGSKISKSEKEKRYIKAYKVGELIAQKGVKKGIEKVVFDRGGYKYHGKVKALAEGAREGGLQF